MGAWDVTAFGNDDAADFSLELQDSAKPFAILERVFGLSPVDGYLDASDGCQIVAGASIVAAALGKAAPPLPPEVNEWLQGNEITFRPLASSALAALRRVGNEQSELRELWEETDDFQAWIAEIEAISAALN